MILKFPLPLSSLSHLECLSLLLAWKTRIPPDPARRSARKLFLASSSLRLPAVALWLSTVLRAPPLRAFTKLHCKYLLPCLSLSLDWGLHVDWNQIVFNC